MSKNLRAFSSVQKNLFRSTHKRCLYPSSTWGFYSLSSRHFASQDDKSNNNGSFKKYGFGILAAIGALFAAYQFNLIPSFGNQDNDADSDGKKNKRPPKVFKYPKDSSLIPTHVPYLLIGGGTASFSAFRAIKSADPTAKVLIIGNEPFNPYMRPPLSKELFYNEDRTLAKSLKFKQWNASERSLFYEPEDFYSPVEALFPPEAKDSTTDEAKPKESNADEAKPKESNPDEAKSQQSGAATNNHGGISVVRGWQVTGLDPARKVATLEDGHTIRYDKCLLATGATPRNLPVFTHSDQSDALASRVTLYRSVADFQALETVIETGGGAKIVAVVGGGFLGSELACALAKRGASSNTRVYQIFREKGNMARVLPDYLSAWTTRKVQQEGVLTLTDVTVEKANPSGSQVELSLSNGDRMRVDHVVVAVGVEPNTQLAKGAGLETDPVRGGYLVNSELVARSDLYSAGDCACFYDVSLGRRRVEHHDHAVQSGRLAGENMTGANKHYLHQSMFWSDLGPDVGYEAIGLVDSSLPTVGVYAKSDEADISQAATLASGTSDRSSASPDLEKLKSDSVNSKGTTSSKQTGEYGKGVIFYLRDDIVVGIVLWNVFNRMAIARQVLKSERKYEDLNEVAKLFNIHAE